MMETLAELPFIGDQVGLFKAQPGRPKVPWYSSKGYREGITPGREISEERGPGPAATDGLAVRVDDGHSVLFFRVFIPQEPHSRHFRRECRDLRFRHRFGAGWSASEKQEQAETQRHGRNEMVSPDDNDLLP